MWKRSAAILEQSTMEATRFYGLTVLQEAVQTRWQIIPVDQREGNYSDLQTPSTSFSP